MAYNGPIWYIDANLGYNSEINGSEEQPLESISYAISRIASIGINTSHYIKVKKTSEPYIGADLRSLSPIEENKIYLIANNPKVNGIPEFNGTVFIKSNMSVEGFKFTRNAEAIVVDEDNVKNVNIKTNVFVLSSTAKCITIGNSAIDIENVKISLNTFVDKGTNQTTGVYFKWGTSPNGIKESVIGSNIFYANGFMADSSIDILTLPYSNLLISNNNNYNVVQPIRNTPNAVNTVIANPQFIDYPFNDFRLQENSPCINAGLLTENSTLDIMENTRPLMRTFDIGAYEYQSQYLSQIIGGNGFIKGNGVVKISILDETKILDELLVSENTHFNNESKWERVITVFKNSSGQNKIITHKKMVGVWTGTVEFSVNAEVGIWEKRELMIADKDGDVLVLKRNTIGDKEDIYVS